MRSIASVGGQDGRLWLQGLTARSALRVGWHTKRRTDDDDEEAQGRVKIDNLIIRKRRRRRRWTTTTTMAITMTTGPGTVLHRW